MSPKRNLNFGFGKKFDCLANFKIVAMASDTQESSASLVAPGLG